MRICTVLGTRPEIIRLSLVIKLLDQNADHVLVHTGQNYDEALDAIFFRELGVRAPDVHLGISGDGFGAQVGQLLTAIEPLLIERRPDALLVLGDTNSGLVAIVARRLGIPVFHMEAGNRCYDHRVPEEVNRRIIDHSSSVLMPYTERSRENLLAEGFARDHIYVIGNPIKQVIDHHKAAIESSDVLRRLSIEERKFFLVTMHRAENVDVESRLRNLMQALSQLHAHYDVPVVCSLHPRTRSKLAKFGISVDGTGLTFLPPLGFFDFIHLEQRALCVLSDSGTVQEEACIFRTPNVTIREVTERPETINCGSNVIAGTDASRVLESVALAVTQEPDWLVPPEYMRPFVAETVCRIVLGHRTPDRAELEWGSALRL